ncbi:MAG: hypothetical protein VW576_08545 [Opitutae bacterium]
MVQTLTFFACGLFFLTGCSPFSGFQAERKVTIAEVFPQHVSEANSTSKFWLKGGVFSISDGGVIFFVDSMDPSIVYKANLSDYKSMDEFIDLKDWLKSDSSGPLQIDDIWVDREDRLILAESVTGKILRISPDARKLENLADSYDGYRLSKICGLIGSSSGEIFVGSPNSATIYRLNSQEGKLLVLNENLVRPRDFILNEESDRLLVAESNPNRVVVYDLNDSSDAMVWGWNLIQFASSREKPISMVAIDHQGNLLAVISGRGKKLQFFDLKRGKLIHQADLHLPCSRVRAHKGWIYLQTRKGIIRKKIPSFINFK